MAGQRQKLRVFTLTRVVLGLRLSPPVFRGYLKQQRSIFGTSSHASGCEKYVVPDSQVTKSQVARAT